MKEFKRLNKVEFSVWVCETCALGMAASALYLILDAIVAFYTM